MAVTPLADNMGSIGRPLPRRTFVAASVCRDTPARPNLWSHRDSAVAGLAPSQSTVTPDSGRWLFGWRKLQQAGPPPLQNGGGLNQKTRRWRYEAKPALIFLNTSPHAKLNPSPDQFIF